MGNENLQNALHQAGLTIEAFARVINVDPKSVGRWVSGNTIPYPRHRQAIARALDLDEHELWPDQTPVSGDDDDTTAGDGCDVVGSWSYANQHNAPNPADLITASDGPIDLLDSHAGIQPTDQIIDRIQAAAAAGRKIRILTETPTRQLAALIAQPNVEIRVDDLWTEFWFLRAGHQMLFAINFQDDIDVMPAPILKLDGTITGGLFERAQGKFEELWQQATEKPQTLVRTAAQLEQMISQPAALATPSHPAGRQPPKAGSNSGAGAEMPPISAGNEPAISPLAKIGESAAPQPRRWPGRHE
ncbi:helix-turn-helix domain-containing protein [Conexibacter sp. S30A1]|uniref:helix-turn-helix domain-containing protein n=1 Tax=Conexibacter sp. S30A1 TaxID=2937800 RepID=UPI00200E644E|nr:helix-turn-helix domain-containing protein [Conexibacter sp. S30A1]